MLTCSAGDIFDLACAMPEGDHIELGALTSAVPTARAWARVVWSGWGLAQLADDASVVLTELVTNAVLHASGEIVDVWLRSDRHRLAIMVGDPSRQMPVRADPPNSEDRFGRGLTIVSALSARWGTYRVQGGKIVWAILA
jgi:anti-sigma regulatory factor (Ser/Thr protein kinase)